MGYHTFDVDRADALEDPDRFRYCSAEELIAALAVSPDAVVADLGSGTGDRKSTRLNSSHRSLSRMPSSA